MILCLAPHRRASARTLTCGATELCGALCYSTSLKRPHRPRRGHATSANNNMVNSPQEIARREEFIAILGHDLRNPLHAVYASGDMLERKLTDPALMTMVSRNVSDKNQRSAHVRVDCRCNRLQAKA